MQNSAATDILKGNNFSADDAWTPAALSLIPHAPFPVADLNEHETGYLPSSLQSVWNKISKGDLSPLAELL